MPQSAYRFETHVLPDGKVDVKVPMAPGTRVEVLVRTPTADEFNDLAQAATSSLEFWDNPADDEAWNNA